ncbi:M90 family metallopeptidase [Hydrogenovibrio halophilus]|uniref:M90 family metallopeptidase n=1 Tax=Hydrogenovibrio halophilus TaxID=373391 RepID=UPI00036F6ED0|nr:M90 family metallopeptidase [Hydrogenovibrio halophilus]
MFSNPWRAWRHWRRQRFLRRYAIGHSLWAQIMRLPMFVGLDAVERARLRELASVFVHDKVWHPKETLVLTDWHRALIAAQACLPGLNLDEKRLQGWRDIILYPAPFWAEHEQVDEAGVVTAERAVLDGEAWLDGPLVLEWQTLEHEAQRRHPHRSVVIHEMAHKLDMGNGRANGMPPLHPDQSRPEWTETFSRAFENLQTRVEHGARHLSLDAYAATNPAEFFAVASEFFFCQPHALHQHEPAVYAQLSAFYRQDPRQRLPHPVSF